MSGDVISIAIFGVFLLLIVIAVILVISYLNKIQRFTLVEYERVAIFKVTGEFVGIKGPGLVRILPAFPPLFPGEQARGQYGQLVTDPADQLSKFDLREVASILEDEHCITSDSAVVNIRPAVVYQITDPQKLVLNVQNHLEALQTAITATLRAVVGSMTLTDSITGREAIATQMRARLAEQADRWGISMISVEIQDIKPEASVERAMNERRAAEENAERDRFELVVRAQARLQGAEADNQASIARADAEKLATITKAEAQKLAAITIAEGEKEAEILRSEGVASLYKVLMGLGAGADVALRYEQIQALKNLGDSSNSKLVIVPANMAAIGGARDVSMIEQVIQTASGDTK